MATEDNAFTPIARTVRRMCQQKDRIQFNRYSGLEAGVELRATIRDQMTSIEERLAAAALPATAPNRRPAGRRFVSRYNDRPCFWGNPRWEAHTRTRGMNREYFKRYSQQLQRDMEMLVFGYAGTPFLVFPTSMGRFFDYEDRGMIRPLSSKIERGQAQVFCVDSVDSESWYNKAVPPRQRVQRHVQYENHLLFELIPLIRSKNASTELTATGCSFGGYHAVNFALRHPDLVTRCVSMGGAFDIHQFLNGYYDDNCYFNCPPDFLPNLADDWYLSRYRNMKIVLATGERDVCLPENLRLSGILQQKTLPHWLDVWGNNTGHDWPWWQQMAVKFFA